MQECFKLHGYPKWYQRYKENKRMNKVHFVDNELEENNEMRFDSLRINRSV